MLAYNVEGSINKQDAMDFLLQRGVDWIVAIQSLGGWLEAPMRFFSYLGSQDFFFLVLPLIYWSVNSRLGLRVGMILMTSVSINFFAKLWFASPRPYWVSSQVNALSSESTFGTPSGHAQNAVSVWGIIASSIRRPWAWVTAFALVFFIGFSRMYLGLHFVHDVVAGWLIGCVLLWAFLRFWETVAAWLKAKTFSQQVTLAFVVSLILVVIGSFSVARLDGYAFPDEWKDNALRAGELPAPVSMENVITAAGTFFGVAFGLAWITSKGGYQADGPAGKRALRFVVGLIGVLILWRGLGMVFPGGENLVGYILRYVRYALVGFWIIGGAPWLFFRFKLADAPKM
jgi:membrane-associated phospholipid phosphatase